MGMELAEKIRRLKKGRSYADIARNVGCSSENIRKIIDQGSHPGFTLGVRLAVVLGVPVDWLADDEQDWPPPTTGEQQAVKMVHDALAGAGLAGELNDPERNILQLYRVMRPGLKRKVEALLQGMNISDDPEAEPK